jgi:hypothetical protein
MKKITAILLLTIYSLTTLGIGIRQFYCCGKLKSTHITLLQESKEKCNNAGGMKGCCKTKFKTVKAKDNHVTGNSTTYLTKHFTDLDIPTSPLELKIISTQPAVVTNTSHAPPGNNIPLYIFHCTYRI